MNKKHLRNAAKCVACSVTLSAISPAWAGAIDIQIPQKGEAVGGANIACVAQFESADQPITRVDFLVDGQRLVPKNYKKPVAQARVTFVWDATGVPPGNHLLTVRAYAGDVIVGEDEVGVVVSDDAQDIVRPQVHLFNPRPNSVVSGVQDVSIHASDNIGIGMISLFIDKQLKLLQNVPPFRYSWDTTQYPNGPHTLEVWAFDAAQNKGETKPIQVFVNNGAGRTEVKDLPDEVPAPIKAESAATPKKATAAKATKNAPKPSALPKAAPQPQAVALKSATPAPQPKSESLATKVPLPRNAPSVAVQPSPKKPPVVAMPKPIAPTPKPAPKAVTAPAAVASPKVAVVPQPKPVLPALKPAELPAPRPVVVPRKTSVEAPASIAAAPMPSVAPKPKVTAKPVRLAKAEKQAAVREIVQPKTVVAPAASPNPSVSARTVATKKEMPTLIARRPADPPMAAVEASLRTTRPTVPAAQPTAKAAPAVVRSAPRVVPATTVVPAPTLTATAPAIRAFPKPAAPKPVRIARAETKPAPALGHARTEEMAPVSASPAAHRTLLARPPLRLMLGQEPVTFDVQPVIEQGVAIAPLRQIIEHTGGMVMWLPAERTVQATSGAQRIEVKIGSRRALINNEVTMMERPAVLKSGRTMVPVRFLQAALDMKAVYDPSKGMVYLYRK